MSITTSINLSPNHYSGRRGAVPHIIGIHTMEAPESGNTAEDVARYFKNSSVQASSHWCVDDDSRVRCVNDADAAWTMPPLNDESLNIEIAGYAKQTGAQWADSFSEEALDIAAMCAAEWCHKYGIPIRHNNAAQIAGKVAGFVGHIDVNRVFHASDHTDPGPNFPWSTFLNKVKAHYDNPNTVTTPKSNPRELQHAIGADPDGVWGPDTDKRAMSVKWAAHSQFPNGVNYVQGLVGSTVTGTWNVNDVKHLDTMIGAVQRALISMKFLKNDASQITGNWTDATNAAFTAARGQFHH